MKRFYTAESVTEGHPDKLCDLIADSILDACLKEDENSKVACEVLATKGNIIVAGEITSRYEPQVFEIVRKVLESAGYEADGIHMDALIHKQSPDIAGAVERSRERRTGTVSVQSGLANGAGDQGIMVGYACDDTPQLMPMPVVLANRIVRELSASRRSGYIMGILPDGKAQVTVEYEDDRPVRLDTVVVSCQHEKEKSLRKLEHEIREKVLRPALRMLPPDEDTKILINPSGRFVCGGLDADTGLTGRKLMVDTYGGLVPHGGGAFSGKDCSKVDRSGAYMARYIAKNMVAAGLASRCQVSLTGQRLPGQEPSVCRDLPDRVWLPGTFFRPYGEPAPCSSERCERSLYRPQFQQRASAFYSEIQAGQGIAGDCSFRLLHFSEGRL